MLEMPCWALYEIRKGTHNINCSTSKECIDTIYRKVTEDIKGKNDMYYIFIITYVIFIQIRRRILPKLINNKHYKIIDWITFLIGDFSESFMIAWTIYILVLK